jgi:general stress protein 26
MVTTLAADGVFRSRPMLLERLEPDGTLTFLTHLSSQKVAEIANDPRVHVAFVGDKGDRYVSVSGTGSATHDPARMHALWNPTYRAWFPNGPDGADSAILTVRIERIEYWDVPSSRMVRLWGAVKALATGQVVEAGDHQTITLGDDDRT